MENLITELENEILSKSKFIGKKIPNVSLDEIDTFLMLLKKVLFPGVFYRLENTDVKMFLQDTIKELNHQLKSILLSFESENEDNISNTFLNSLPNLKQVLMDDINAIYNGDPAAESHEEVVLAYPSFEAIMIYRIAHELTQLNLNLFARMCSSIAHRKTGIDIHPKAQIGRSFCIDHGTAIVIGESAIIGQNVKLYQGVTIGALSVSKAQKNKKRHPTIEDNVTIYARTTILGGGTVIGKNSVIGGNVWLTSSVPQNSKIYNQEAST
ncbi:MAG: serine O-acetyltransferase EpsC [Candidatus Marinamargulisbacteria bacterium]